MTNDESRILISNELVDQLPDIDQISGIIDELLLVYIRDDASGVEISGSASSLLFADDPEVEVKMSISGALDVLKNREKALFTSIKVAHNKNLIQLEGKYEIHAAKIFNVNVEEQSCILAVGLKQVKKDLLTA